MDVNDPTIPEDWTDKQKQHAINDRLRMIEWLADLMIDMGQVERVKQMREWAETSNRL